jgi:hypothetical protein
MVAFGQLIAWLAALAFGRAGMRVSESVERTFAARRQHNGNNCHREEGTRKLAGQVAS